MCNKIKINENNYPQWKLQDNLLYKLIPSNIPVESNIPEWKIVVPKHQRQKIMKLCHEPSTCGHLGSFKTFSRVKELYYWPKMRADINKFIKQCKICGANKIYNQPGLGLMGEEKNVNFPWQVIAVDLMGPFPRSKSGNTFLLEISDWFTKYVILHPLRKATAENIAKFLESDVFLKFGVPQFIISDNGTQFAGRIMKNLAKS